MGFSAQMDPLDFLTNEDLLLFFRRKKTEMSCIDQPHTFLTQLRDYDLLPEKLYKKLKTTRSREQKQKGVYEVLDCIEKENPNHMLQFWRCVFKDHILQQYPTIRLLRNSLLDGSFKFYEEPSHAEVLPETEKNEGTQEKAKKAKKRKVDDASGEDSDSPGPSSSSKPARKKLSKKLSFSSPVKKGDSQEIWKWPIYKTQLPVTCGTQEGNLHRDKLAKGEKCIFAQKRWFSPSGFEQFGGKERCKNWKQSIRCRKTPLKKLIEEGHLQCPPIERRKRTCVLNTTPVRLSDSSAENSSTNSSETSPGTEEERDAEDFEEQGGMEFRERVEEEEEEDMEDLSVFQTPSLPVTCVSLSATLHKYRFASGLRGKCIRTDESWLTPEEFVKQETTLTDPNWRRDIMCHGKTLNFLLKKDILRIHSLLCECEKCSDQEHDLSEQRNDDVCYECGSDGDLVCCDECPRAFHSQCHLPAVNEDSTGEWMCTFCVLRTNQQWRNSSHITEEEALKLPVSSQYRLYCDYLLLYMYREDPQHVFVKDPRKTVRRYAEFVTHPMWLDRIKLKLEAKDYHTVGDFVSDIQLIFSNCRTFNRDNDFGKMGARLKDLIDREFKKVFSIQ
ncbi:uncharacterized protein [Paramisgurnus dabryanus]|uniref:uncharacterized protein n=1 Tax=Paramisgurnus dabryanus TaxID=90735 RepID=UPI0031F40B11